MKELIKEQLQISSLKYAVELSEALAKLQYSIIQEIRNRTVSVEGVDVSFSEFHDVYSKLKRVNELEGCKIFEQIEFKNLEPIGIALEDVKKRDYVFIEMGKVTESTLPIWKHIKLIFKSINDLEKQMEKVSKIITTREGCVITNAKVTSNLDGTLRVGNQKVMGIVLEKVQFKE